MTYKVGDKVWWESQSQGHATTKTGEVVHVFRPGEAPNARFLGLKFPDHNHSFLGGGFGRGHQSYLVSVQTTKKAKPRLYWPVVAKLNPED